MTCAKCFACDILSAEKVMALEVEAKANADTIQMLRKSKEEWEARRSQLLSKLNVNIYGFVNWILHHLIAYGPFVES